MAAARGAGSPLGRPLRFDLCGDRRRAGAGTEAHPGRDGDPPALFQGASGASRKGLACDCLQASERRLAGRKLDRLFAECRPLGGTDRDRLFPGAARQHRAPRRESGRCRVLEIGTGVFFHRRASFSREHFRYSMGLGSVRGDMNLAGRVSARFVAAGRGAPCFPARLRQTFAGSGRRFARGIFRFTVFPARTEGYGAIFAITV